MLVSFTQTYGDERKQLYDIYNRDEKLIEFKNLFDLNIYSFHNSSEETIEYFKSINKVNNIEILKTNKRYTYCIRDLINYLKDIKCSHLFFSQDDTFSNDNNIDFKKLLEFVKLCDNNFMLSLYYHKSLFDNLINLDLKEDLGEYKIYDNNSLNFKYIRRGGMDDTPYICSIDMLDKIYDHLYYFEKHVWHAEMYLMKKFLNEKINRFIGNKSLFENYNILGRTIHSKDYYIQKLKNKNLYVI